jgi:hypothetical protein
MTKKAEIENETKRLAQVAENLEAERQRLNQLAQSIDTWQNYKIQVEGQLISEGITLENIRTAKLVWRDYIQ